MAEETIQRIEAKSNVKFPPGFGIIHDGNYSQRKSGQDLLYAYAITDNTKVNCSSSSSFVREKRR